MKQHDAEIATEIFLQMSSLRLLAGAEADRFRRKVAHKMARVMSEVDLLVVL